MPRGRPKGSKNKVKSTTLFECNESAQKIEESNDIKEISSDKAIKNIKIEKPLKTICNCDLCGSPIYSSPNVVKLQEVTSKAYWHRNLIKDKFNLCNVCAVELNNEVEKFLLSKNKGLARW